MHSIRWLAALLLLSTEDPAVATPQRQKIDPPGDRTPAPVPTKGVVSVPTDHLSRRILGLLTPAPDPISHRPGSKHRVCIRSFASRDLTFCVSRAAFVRDRPFEGLSRPSG